MIEVIIVTVAFLFIALKILSSSRWLKGRRGERRVGRTLRRLCRRGDFRLLNDIYIKSCDKESQIDHILIGKTGIFVIETKTYKGLILGNERDKEWVQNLYGEHTFYNPVRQNWGHIRTLKYLLDGACSDWCYHSLVVFPSGTDILTDSDKVVVLKELKRKILSFRNEVLTQEQMDDIESLIRKANIVSRKERWKHVRRIRKEFRKKCR